jgi:hypothetical protein
MIPGFRFKGRKFPEVRAAVMGGRRSWADGGGNWGRPSEIGGGRGACGEEKARGLLSKWARVPLSTEGLGRTPGAVAKPPQAQDNSPIYPYFG